MPGEPVGDAFPLGDGPVDVSGPFQEFGVILREAEIVRTSGDHLPVGLPRPGDRLALRPAGRPPRGRHGLGRRRRGPPAGAPGRGGHAAPRGRAGGGRARGRSAGDHQRHRGPPSRPQARAFGPDRGARRPRRRAGGRPMSSDGERPRGAIAWMASNSIAASRKSPGRAAWIDRVDGAMEDLRVIPVSVSTPREGGRIGQITTGGRWPVVPGDRRRDGLVGEFSLWENMLLSRPALSAAAPRGWMTPALWRRRARGLLEEFDVRPPNPDLPAAARRLKRRVKEIEAGREARRGDG